MESSTNTGSFEAPLPYYSQGLRAKFHIDGIRAEQSKLETSGKFADIGYEVEEYKYRARSEARVKAGGLPDAVPAGWPTELKGPLVWSSDSFSDEKEYVYNLTVEDKVELLDALEYFNGKSPRVVARKTPAKDKQTKALMAPRSPSPPSPFPTLARPSTRSAPTSTRTKASPLYAVSTPMTTHSPT